MSNMNLSNFANGAVGERLDIELRKLLENIQDPNTDPKKVRKLQLTISLKADEQRDIANVSVTAKATLAPAKDIETKIVMDRDSKGDVVGSELKSGIKGQAYIDDEGEVKDDRGENIVDFKNKESASK